MKKEYGNGESLFEATRRYEEAQKGMDGQYRMTYHLMPPVGWLNDPNGLCVYNGCCHVFFQYTPAAASGEGYRGWGHYTSEDMLRWNYEGLAIAPDTDYDKDGAYSGSALAESDRLYLYYTGNVKEPGAHDYILSGRGANVIRVESRDGFRMGEKRLLLTNSDYPSDYSCHVRDPKVWKEHDSYYMVLGGRTRENQGKALVYRSENNVDWRIINQVTTAEAFGYMWECPDFFSLNGNSYLSISPQGIAPEEFRYQNIYQSGYFRLTETVDKECRPYDFREWDMGFDFYAPQTFADGRGRRILYGWAGVPDAEYTNPTVEQGWQHCLTMPREITEKDGVLYQNPLEEMKSLRGKGRAVPSGESVDTPKSYELCISRVNTDTEAVRAGEGNADTEAVRAGEADADMGSLRVTLCNGLVFSYDGHKELRLEFVSGIGAGRTVRKALLNRVEDIRIFVDVSIVEIFINHGALTFTTRFYPQTYNLKVETRSTGNMLWELSI